MPASDNVSGPQVVDEPLEHPGLLEDRGQVRLVGRIDAIEDGLEVAGDDREWRAQLVADVREERPPLFLVRLEPGGHGVEPSRQFPDRGQV